MIVEKLLPVSHYSSVILESLRSTALRASSISLLLQRKLLIVMIEMRIEIVYNYWSIIPSGNKPTKVNKLLNV